MSTSITLIKSEKPHQVCKTYATGSDGTLYKDVVANVTEGVAKTVQSKTAEDMATILRSVTNSADLVICPGVWANSQEFDKFHIVSEAKLCQTVGGEMGKVAGGVIDHNGKPIAARLKRGIAPSVWVLIDADDPVGMPAEWVGLPIGTRLEMLEPVIKGISKCERIELRGSSNRVRKEGEEPKQASHAWIQVDNPGMIETMREVAKVQSELKNVAFPSPRFSRETGEIIGNQSRTLIDLSVWCTGRLVFCAKPDITKAAGYVVDDADIKIINEGKGPLKISALQLPADRALKQYSDKTGQRLSYNRDGTGLRITATGELTLDTLITSKGSERPLGSWVADMRVGDKLRCEAPFRASESESAFVRIADSGVPFVHDVGTGTTYTISNGSAIVALTDSAREQGAADMPSHNGPANNRNPRGPNFPDVKVTKIGTSVMPTRANVEELISWAEIDVRFDVFTRRIVAWRNGQEIKNHIDAELIDLAAKTDLPKSAILDQLDAIAASRPLNKPQQWLEKLEKPNGDPLAEWLLENGFVSPHTDQPVQEQWGYVVWRRFFVACCAAADQLEKCTNKDAVHKFEQVLVIVSKQGKKKSTALMQMLPPELREYYKGGVHLNLSQKDSLVEATSAWIAELGELDATFRKSDISALKAFLSRSDDTIRMPYDRRAQVVPRRTVYFATVNEDKFLQDVTGNRRYLPITLHDRLTYSEEIGKNIFAQAWHRYIGGEQWWLSDNEEISAIANQDKHDGNSLIPMLEDAFAFDESRRDLAVKPGIILDMLGFRGAAMASNTTRLASALRQLEIERYGTSVRDRRHYAMPPVTGEYLHKYKQAIGERDE